MVKVINREDIRLHKITLYFDSFSQTNMSSLIFGLGQHISKLTNLKNQRLPSLQSKLTFHAYSLKTLSCCVCIFLSFFQFGFIVL